MSNDACAHIGAIATVKRAKRDEGERWLYCYPDGAFGEY
jgi:hypothetical protein